MTEPSHARITELIAEAERGYEVDSGLHVPPRCPCSWLLKPGEPAELVRDDECPIHLERPSVAALLQQDSE